MPLVFFFNNYTLTSYTLTNYSSIRLEQFAGQHSLVFRRIIPPTTGDHSSIHTKCSWAKRGAQTAVCFYILLTTSILVPFIAEYACHSDFMLDLITECAYILCFSSIRGVSQQSNSQVFHRYRNILTQDKF